MIRSRGRGRHRTSVPNVLMLGAATWPGHGINGSSGYIVAQELLAQAAKEKVQVHALHG